MIRRAIVNTIRASTCAVVRLDEKHEETLVRIEKGEPVGRLPSQVVGTAFLVRDDVVLTNRHIVMDVYEDDKNLGNHDNWYLEIVYPMEGINDWGTTHVRIKNIFAFVDPSRDDKLDVGLMQFQRVKGEAFHSFIPVKFGNLDSIIVGADVGICGFPTRQ